jgi:CheY-like chemotaxis protein
LLLSKRWYNIFEKDGLSSFVALESFREKVTSRDPGTPLFLLKERDMSSKEFLTTGEAARLVNISRSTISRNFDKGIFQGKKNPITGERMISRESLINFLKQFNLPVDHLSVEKKRILAGTSDDHLYSHLHQALSQDGRVEIERVGFGGDVLIACSKSLPDLLILDEELADIPCMEIIRSLRRMTDQRGLKILCSAKSRNTRRCLEWGADEALSKESSGPEEWGKAIYPFLNLPPELPEEEPNFKHQRRWPRRPLHLPLKIGIYSLRTPYRRDSGQATLENISLGGAYLSNISLDGGKIPCEPFRILLESDQEPLKDWKAHGKVVRLQSNGAVTAGVQFTRVPKASLKMIETLAQ